MIVNQSGSNPNFTSRIPVKIFQNGELLVSEKEKSAAFKALRKEIKTHSNLGSEMLGGFTSYDRDFTDAIGLLKQNVPLKRIRNYILTGQHAQEIESLGTEVCKAQARVNRHVVDADQFVDTSLEKLKSLLLQAKSNYSKTIQQIFESPGNLIRERFNPKSRQYEGDAVELWLNVKNASNKTLKIESFCFKPKKTNQQPKATEIAKPKPQRATRTKGACACELPPRTSTKNQKIDPNQMELFPLD